jgi:CheY-like chemotaxis protein
MKEGVDSIISSAEAQARLIEDLLDTSRITMGKLRLEMVETDLVEVVRTAIEQIFPAARAKSLRIESELDPGAGVVFADPMRIRQVVWNLLGNAVKFTPKEGRVNVTLRRSGNEVEIAVSDTGCGISEAFLPCVFDRFRQHDSSHTRKYGGLGLGLTISKQLVELHGGTIHAASAGTDLGATFTVRLPLPAVHRQASGGAQGEDPRVALAPPDTRFPGLKILVVEDELVTRDVLSRILRQTGATVSTARSGAEAVQAYGTSLPDLVLCDIGLPDFDGYAVLRKIREIESERKLTETPAIALTAYAREEDRKKAADAGFRKHMAKPLDTDKLLAAIAALARGS